MDNPNDFKMRDLKNYKSSDIAPVAQVIFGTLGLIAFLLAVIFLGYYITA